MDRQAGQTVGMWSDLVRIIAVCGPPVWLTVLGAAYALGLPLTDLLGWLALVVAVTAWLLQL